MRPEVYRVSGLTLESSVSLPELTPAGGVGPECRFLLLPSRTPGPASIEWFHQWRLPDGPLWLGLGRLGQEYLLRFPDLADFFVSSDGSAVRCQPVPGIPLETIRHLLLDQVIPLVLSQRGRLVLHASAVKVASGGVAFLGMTGEGKSTLTASFSQDRFPLLTDDCLVVDDTGGEFLGIPSYPGLRLWPEVIAALFEPEPRLAPVAHYTRKRRLGKESDRLLFCSDPVPLRRLYVLAPAPGRGEPNAVTITPLSPRDTMMELVQYTYCLDIADREQLRRGFESLGRAAASRPLCRLTFPRDLSFLPAVRAAILQDLDGGR